MLTSKADNTRVIDHSEGNSLFAGDTGFIFQGEHFYEEVRLMEAVFLVAVLMIIDPEEF